MIITKRSLLIYDQRVVVNRLRTAIIVNVMVVNGTTAPAQDGFAGPLAEFAELRTEIQERVKAQQQFFALQLTTAGGVIGFALSRSGLTGLLLIVPFSSFLLCGRLVAQHFGLLRVAEYIRDELSPRVPGGLGWEDWLHQRGGRPPFVALALPLLLTFVGAAALALWWTAGFVYAGDGESLSRHVGLIALWLAGLGVSVLSARLVLQMAGYLRVDGWDHAGVA